jgi:hypothetical protein
LPLTKNMDLELLLYYTDFSKRHDPTHKLKACNIF